MVVGGIATVFGLVTHEPEPIRVGALLAVLPVVSALVIRGFRYRLRCVRRLDPPRVPAGQPAAVTMRVENESRRPTSVLLAEDVIPRTLGGSPRFVLEEIEPGGHRELSYQIASDIRGEFTVGPLRIRVTDAFGLVRTTRSLRLTSTLIVTPKIVRLPRVDASAGCSGAGGAGMQTTSVAGEDDAVPRVYRDGDSLRRVHWKATARHGELMVRPEEQQVRGSASVFLDTRRCAHAGRGRASTFEFAVSAAASISAHLTEDGFRTRLVTEAGEITAGGVPSGAVLDTLAVITTSSETDLRRGVSALTSADGPLIAVTGRLSADEAAALAAVSRGNAPAMALLPAATTWTSGGRCQEAARAAQILSAAGWRVAVVTARTSLAAAWRELHGLPEPVTPWLEAS